MGNVIYTSDTSYSYRNGYTEDIVSNSQSKSRKLNIVILISGGVITVGT